MAIIRLFFLFLKRFEFIKIPFTDLESEINKFFHTRLQQYWNYNIHKLFQIKLTLGEWKLAITHTHTHTSNFTHTHIYIYTH